MRSSSAGASRAFGLLGLFVAVSMAAGALAAGLFVPAVAAAGGATRGGIDWFNDLKAVPPTTQLSQQSLLLAKDGTVIARFFSENRSEVPLAKISKNMQNAIIAIEDKRFLDHGGVDPVGLVRAAVTNYLGSGADEQGASTLTQQYIKNLNLEQAVYNGDKTAQNAAIARSASRKITEIRAAIELEKTMTKQQILEGYLNTTFFGNRAYGVEAAAHTYFSIPAAQLDAAQSALLAGMVQAPNSYDPLLNSKTRQAGLDRRNIVLGNMHELKMLSDADYTKAVATPITLKVTRPTAGCVGAIQGLGFFCDYVYHLILSGNDAFGRLGATAAQRKDAINRGGLTIQTSLDLKAQAAAQRSIQKYVPIGDPSRAATAAVTVEPGTGHVIAMAQNKKFGTVASPSTTSLNYNVDSALGGGAGFQTGSTFKAFTLGAWLKDGKHLNDVVDASRDSIPVSDFTDCNGHHIHSTENYSFANSEPNAAKQLNVLDATANSVNTAFVNMETQLDLCDVSDFATSLGVHLAAKNKVCNNQSTGFEVPDCLPSLTLGPLSIAPITMASAYATFAAEGRYCPPFPVLSISKDKSDVPIKKPSCKDNAIDPDIAHGVTYALKNVITRGTAVDIDNDIKAPVAGKTGTTDASVDTWFVGYTHSLTTAVWVGDDVTAAKGRKRSSLNGRTIGGTHYDEVFGATISAHIWSGIMQAAVPGTNQDDWDDPPNSMKGQTQAPQQNQQSQQNQQGQQPGGNGNPVAVPVPGFGNGAPFPGFGQRHKKPGR